MKRTVTIVATLLVTSLFTLGPSGVADFAAGVAVAAEDEADGSKGEKKEIKGSDAKGKYFFKKQCKNCHGKKDEGGEVTPISKTIKQWERYFKKAKHTEEMPFDSLGTEEERIHIRTFLINHAADSDQPETCG